VPCNILSIPSVQNIRQVNPLAFLADGNKREDPNQFALDL
jgi:hypothetical protein